ncbi:AraC family transcriptional regulator [[Eubacterium] hominis]|uniref:AraC family transcriptional regulator n=1 Tax=[Eubacterium] hominis TaxID=2764325 RepID=UPI003A4D52AE
MEWLKKLSEAIDYIEHNLDNEISYDKAAQIACCSTYYFQRLFSYVCGISLSEYIRRRRMTQAAFDLQRTNAKVIDVALKYGYTSPTSFNRAFQNVHNITPALARNMGNPLNAFMAIHFSIQVTGEKAMSYYITKKSSMRMVGCRTPLTTDMEENQKHIPHFWKSVLHSHLFSKLCDLSDRSAQNIFGISAYDASQSDFYYIAVNTSASVPVGMFEFEIPSTTWVVFESDGDYKENVQRIFKRFYTEWLPFSGYHATGSSEIEVYPIDKEAAISGHLEVWFAITKDKEDKECII